MITITIKTENAAFQDGQQAGEVARILRALALQVEHGIPRVQDINGNTCGRVTLTGKDREL